jgi:anti-sigma regulatory factor (Ser/Thr protein kinase)
MSNADITRPAEAFPPSNPDQRSKDADVHPEPDLDQPFDEDALFTLRSAVAAHAAELGAGAALSDTVLVAHELSSNAVRHGGGAGRLRLWRASDHLYCQVTDAGPGLSDPEHAGTSRPPPSIPGGRGLWIARQMAELRIDTGPNGTTVTAAIAIPE